MSNSSVNCKNCGAVLDTNEIDLNGFCKCSYCGSPQKVLESGSDNVILSIKALLENAEINIKNNNCEKAVKCYNKIIELKPNCHEAWWGLYLCNRYFDEYYGYEDKFGNRGTYSEALIKQKTINKYAQKAIDYAPKEQSKIYYDFIKDDLTFIEKVINGEYDKKEKNGQSGCYIATAVYGSYNCEEVVLLRKYRDEYLYKKWWGRAFIKIYYFFSPSLSKYIKPTSFVGRKLRKYFDNKVKLLNIK